MESQVKSVDCSKLDIPMIDEQRTEEELTKTIHFDVKVLLVKLQASTKDTSEDVRLDEFVSAYDELNKFIGMLGAIFHFVQKDVSHKTTVLKELMILDSEKYSTVSEMANHEKKCTKRRGMTALLGLHRALEFIVQFMDGIAEANDSDSVSTLCHQCYDRTLARFHNWVIRKAVGLAAYTLPSRHALIVAIQGNKPDELYLRKVLGEVVDAGHVAHKRMDAIYSINNMHSLL